MISIFRVFLTAGVIVLAPLVDGACAYNAKSFIYVVPDGYGPASQTLTRDFESITTGQSTINRPNSTSLGVDSLVIGNVRTQAIDNIVTDSAASATAFACGVRTYNGGK